MKYRQVVALDQLVIFLSSFSLLVSPLNSAKQLAVADRADQGVVHVFVSLVQVDAVVTNRKGQPVTDLRPEDFEILQDGKPQTITNF